MKILHITHSYAPLGGAEYYIYNVCSEIEKQGHKNVIICSEKHNTTWPEDGKKVFFIKNITDFDCSDEINDKALSLVKTENPDIIFLHIFNNATLAEKLLTLKPIIRYVHNHNLYCPSGFATNRLFDCTKKFGFLCLASCFIGNCIGCKPTKAIEKYNAVKANLNIAKKFNALIVASEFMKRNLVANGIDKNKIHIIPYFTYPKETQNTSDDAKTILFAGRICKSKGPDYLIRAVKFIRQPYRLTIAGDGYYTGHIKSLAQVLGVYDNIDFRGWLNQKELDICYEQASVVVIPSVWPEPFGIVGIEAMSYGKPVVAFDSGGISEWLSNQEGGFLVRKNDIAALADRINTLLEDTQLRKRFGENGARVVREKFSPQRHIELLLNLFSKFI